MAEACPICGRKPDAKTRPFCSPRCADIDLGRWFTGQYRIPARPEEEEAEGRLIRSAASATRRAPSVPKMPR